MIRQLPKDSKEPLSKHFNAYEFCCHCDYPDCVSTYISTELIEALQKLRDMVGPLKIHDGYRCKMHNSDVNGHPKSFHILGMAADCSAHDLLPEQLLAKAETIEDFRSGGIGLYSWGLHLDVRGTPARWEIE